MFRISALFFNKYAILIVLILTCTFTSLLSQQTSYQLLEKARKAYQNQQPDSAFIYINQFLQVHPENIYGMQYKAWLLDQSGKTQKALAIYREAIQKYPENTTLLLEYIRVLFREKEYETASPLLDRFLARSPQNIEALLYQGYLDYWEADYSAARSMFDRVRELDPGHSEANAMLQEIRRITSPSLEVSSRFETENQPLSRLSSQVKAKKYFNQFLDPAFNIRHTRFWSPSEEITGLFSIAGNNTFHFVNSRIRWTIQGGITLINSHEINAEPAFYTRIEKDLGKLLTLSVNGRLEPEFNTLASLEEIVRTRGYRVELSFSENTPFLGKTAWEQRFYENGSNAVNTLFIWGLSPTFGWTGIQFRLGYGFNYMDSKEVRFTNIRSIDEISMDFDPEQQIEGRYDPYFTPVDQKIHSLLINMEMNLTKRISIFLQANIGLLSESQIPYLYLDRQGNDFIIQQDFSTHQQENYDLKADLALQTGKSGSIHLEYRFFRNFFFDQHSLGVTWNGLLTND